MSTTPSLTGATWRKAKASQNNGNCVEVARLGQLAGVRDSKNVEAGHLTVTAAAFDQFLAGIRAGEFDI